MDVHKIPELACFQRFVPAMRELWKLDLSEDERWKRVGGLLPMLLDDPELRAHAATWDLTLGPDDKYTNLLFYEDPDYGFVINGLVKGPSGVTPVHDHAHTWTAYSVIYGSEDVIRMQLDHDAPAGKIAKMRETGHYTVKPGFVDVVPPRLLHMERVGDAKTAAIIVRSARVGGFDQRMWNNRTHEHFIDKGPRQVPFELGA